VDSGGGLYSTAGEKKMHGTFIDTGAPHVVIFESGLERLDVMEFGRAIRRIHVQSCRHKLKFRPDTERSTVELRTYERGVEVRDPRVGTGSVASRACQFGLYTLTSPVAGLPERETLFVYFKKTERVDRCVSRRSAHMLFKGRLL